MPRFWEWMKKESKALTVLFLAITTLFTGILAYTSVTESAANQNVREYITGMRKGEYKIDLGKGEYIGAKFLVDYSTTPYQIAWCWRKNTEPSQITRDNAEWVSQAGMTLIGLDRETLQKILP